MQGSVRALKAAPKLHNYICTRNKNSDTQIHTYKKTYTHPKLTEEENDFKIFVKLYKLTAVHIYEWTCCVKWYTACKVRADKILFSQFLHRIPH